MPRFLVGVHCPNFCDQPYIRDRDSVHEAETEAEAIRLWIEEHKHWIRTDEKHLVQVLKAL